MNKTKIIVPAGIKFLSEWPDLQNIIPAGHVIINKTLTGCGFTEWVIRNNIPTIWCSPRKILLENKEDQHPGEIYYARSQQPELEVDKDLTKDPKREAPEEETYEFDFTEFENGILQAYHQFIISGRCPKFCVTNDSFRKLKEVLIKNQIFDQFVIAVDEFQTIFQDGRFKPDTELEFVFALQDCNNVIYVSATPMIEESLDEVDEFMNLPYLEFDWETAQPGRTKKAKIKSNPCKSINSVAKKYISDLLDGKYEKKILFDSNGNPIKTVEAKELIIYVNSVKNIGDIVRQNHLTVANTAVICADSRANRRKIREAFRKSYQSLGYTSKEISQLLPDVSNILSKPATKGAPNKMITLCTKTTYIGADFYSKCARTLILSDSGAECMAVDITLDLPQIMGRQRDDENPWKNEADIWYKLGPGDITPEQFQAIVDEKINDTNNLLLSVDSTPEIAKHTVAAAYLRQQKAENYRYNYLGVNKHAGNVLKPQLNKIVMIAEKRAFQIANIDYKDRFTVMAAIDSLDTIELDESTLDLAVFDLEFKKYTQFQDKMKLVCDTAKKMDLKSKEYYEFLNYIPDNFAAYLNTLGPDKILAYGCQKSKIEEEFQKSHTFSENLDPLRRELDREFKVLGKYLKLDIKEKLKEIYQKVGITKTPKASDLEEWYELKSCKITNKETGKRDHAFEIISKK